MVETAALRHVGLGITLLPSYMVDDASDLMILAVDDIPISNDFRILSHTDLHSTERVRVVRQRLYEELSRVFAWLMLLP